MKYGYARVSTARQQQNGNSLCGQREQLLAAGAETVINEQCTGTRLDRPEFGALMDRLQSGDTLLVTRLDRFARTASDGAELVQSLVQRGVVVEVLNMGRADNTPMGRLMISIMLAFAEYERDIIVERTQAGKDIARKNGVRVDGRPKKYTTKQLDHAISLLSEHSFSEVADITGISRSTLIRESGQRKAYSLTHK